MDIALSSREQQIGDEVLCLNLKFYLKIPLWNPLNQQKLPLTHTAIETGMDKTYQIEKLYYYFYQYQSQRLN